MDFVVKMVNDGDSRIGIKYEHEYQAVKLYEELIQNGLEFRLKIELFNKHLNLQVLSESNGYKLNYTALHYSSEQMKCLIQAIENSVSFEFLHLFSKKNMSMVAKPFREKKFISVRSIEILNPVNL